jgi:hypothetical protein
MKKSAVFSVHNFVPASAAVFTTPPPCRRAATLSRSSSSCATSPGPQSANCVSAQRAEEHRQVLRALTASLLRELRSISFHVEVTVLSTNKQQTLSLQIANHVSAQRAEHNLYSFIELKSIANHVQKADRVLGQRAEEHIYSVAEH